MFHQIKPISPVCTVVLDIKKPAQVIILHDDVRELFWNHDLLPLVRHEVVRGVLSFCPSREELFPIVHPMESEDLNSGAFCLEVNNICVQLI